MVTAKIATGGKYVLGRAHSRDEDIGNMYPRTWYHSHNVPANGVQSYEDWQQGCSLDAELCVPGAAAKADSLKNWVNQQCEYGVQSKIMHKAGHILKDSRETNGLFSNEWTNNVKMVSSSRRRRSTIKEEYAKEGHIPEIRDIGNMYPRTW